METKYFYLHVFVNRNESYSFVLKMEVPIGTDVQDEDVIKFASNNYRFEAENDEKLVDTVDEISEKEYNIHGVCGKSK